MKRLFLQWAVFCVVWCLSKGASETIGGFETDFQVAILQVICRIVTVNQEFLTKRGVVIKRP
ncbi:hypothetical protein [Shimia sp. MIT910701]|jgi:hypothetical protein|uniref:hypothetical protein n=1 Tax=Shimia sp. MIT910701 TaxID=3096987 RepID=UPI00399BE5C4